MRGLEKITGLDKDAMKRARERWNSVAKPLHSLGLLEDDVVKIAGIKKSADFEIKKRAVAVMCADNGVTAAGVTQTGSEVTALVAAEIAKGNSCVNCIARAFGAEVIAADVGMNTSAAGVKERKTASGTRDMTKGPATSRKDAEKAVETGIDIAGELKDEGFDIIVAGEMGIGNTTTAAAIASVLLGVSPEKTVGRGAGLGDDGLRRKIAAVKRAIEVNKPEKSDPVGILSKVGGFDICAMAGLFLGGAIWRVPIITDGLISLTAAALAAEIEPKAKDFMLASHVSKEPAAKMLMEAIGLEAPIKAGLALGEGTGGAMLLPLLDGAIAVYNTAHRFENLPMERYVEL